MVPIASPHAILIFQERMVIYANPRALQMSGWELDDLVGIELERLLSEIFPNGAARIERLFRWAEKGEQSDPYSGLCLTAADRSAIWIDLLLSPTVFQDAPAVLMVWIDNSPRLQAEARLSENIWQLQILQDINHAILSVKDDAQIAEVALRHISYLANNYHSSTVHLVDLPGNTAHLVASDSPFSNLREPIKWELLAEFPENLSQGLPQVISDLAEIEPRNPVLEPLYRLGVRSTLVVPMSWDGELHGLLSLYSASPAEFPFERVQAAQEIANLLAVAFKHTQLKQVEVEKRLLAEAVRDVFSSALLTGDNVQINETIQNGMHQLVNSEWAWLFLRSPQGHFAIPGVQGSEQVKSFPRTDPLIQDLLLAHTSLIVPDLQNEPDYQSWLELEPVRNWMGAPLLSGDQLTGLLAVASPQPGVFLQTDADQLGQFAAQIAPVIFRIFHSEQI
jgi:GAF domain-containing protein